MRTNIHGTENVVDAALDAGAVLIAASTSEIYGKNTKIGLREDDDRILGSPLQITVELRRSQSHRRKPHRGHRPRKRPARRHRPPFQHRRPPPDRPLRHGHPRFTRQALAGQPLTVYGTGQQIRCFCHVHDIIPALTALAHTPAAYGHAVNLGSTEQVTINTLASKIITATRSASAITTAATSTPTAPATKTCSAASPTAPSPAPSPASAPPAPSTPSSTTSSRTRRPAAVPRPRRHDGGPGIVRGKTAVQRISPAAQRTQLGLTGRLRQLGFLGHRSRKRPILTLATADGAPLPGGAPWQRRSMPTAVWLAVVPAGALLVALTVYTYQTVHTAAPPRVVVASLPYWDIGYGIGTVLAHRQDVNEVSPWMYGLGGDGQIVLDSGVDQPLMTQYLGQLRDQGLPIVPTLANIDPQGTWSYQLAAGILHNPAHIHQHVAAIVALVQREKYAGIDIDYEELHAADRGVFTEFLGQLAAALHAKGKILSVALFAKTTNTGYAPRNVAQDYAAIGRVADQVRLMGYDYHWNTSPPGPVAPIGWIRDVLRYAKTQIPAAKIILGVPLYGYDWSDGYGSSVTWLRALRLSRQYHVTPTYDTAAQAPWFSYTDSSGHMHTVWFENAESSKAKFGAAQGAGIGGVYLWMYGYQDTGTWPALRQVLPMGKQEAAPAPREAS